MAQNHPACGVSSREYLNLEILKLAHSVDNQHPVSSNADINYSPNETLFIYISNSLHRMA